MRLTLDEVSSRRPALEVSYITEFFKKQVTSCESNRILRKPQPAPGKGELQRHNEETRSVMQRYGIVVFAAGLIAATGLADSLGDTVFEQWPLAGQNLSNTRSTTNEVQISTANAASLAVKWTLTTGGDVSATPTVAGNAVYVPDWAGNVYAVERNTGNVIWSVQVPQLDGVKGAVSRVSPAVHGSDVIIGDIENDGATALHGGANLMALDRQTGALHWKTQIDNQGMAIITGSPVVYGDVVYVGISSNEEILAIPNTYACCVFRGSVVAVDANTGKVLWKTYT